MKELQCGYPKANDKDGAAQRPVVRKVEIVQTAARVYVARRRFARALVAANQLQRAARGRLARSSLRTHVGATMLIQREARRRACELRYAKVLESARCVQTAGRRRLCRRSFSRARDAATRLQAAARMRTHIDAYGKQRKAIRAIQCMMRRYCIRCDAQGREPALDGSYLHAALASTGISGTWRFCTQVSAQSSTYKDIVAALVAQKPGGEGKHAGEDERSPGRERAAPD